MAARSHHEKDPRRQASISTRRQRKTRPGDALRASLRHNTIDQILAESVEREEAGVQLYRDLMDMVKDKSITLEEYAQRLVAAEVVHIREMELMLMKSAPE